MYIDFPNILHDLFSNPESLKDLVEKVIVAVVTGIITLLAVYLGFKLGLRKYVREKAIERQVEWYSDLINSLLELETSVVAFLNLSGVFNDERMDAWRLILNNKQTVIRKLKEGLMYVDSHNMGKIFKHLIAFNDVSGSDKFLPFSKHVEMAVPPARRNDELIKLMSEECERLRGLGSDAYLEVIKLYRKKSKTPFVSVRAFFFDKEMEELLYQESTKKISKK